MSWAVIQGDCIESMRQMEDGSIDAIVTDPPYGLSVQKPEHIAAAVGAWLAGETYQHKGKGFMGKEWDAFVPGPEVWREALRVLKPGGHMVAFAGSRTVDLMGLAIRLAGFEIRDQLQWIYGSGFPKSTKKGALPGWGTALKPAHEPIILARRPLIGTVAKNVTEHGTGGINVDGCRVATTPEDLAKLQASTAAVIAKGGVRGDSWKNSSDLSGANPVPDAGRWPANVILDEEAGAMLDEQSGDRPGMSGGGKHRTRKQTIAGGGHDGDASHIRSDNGGASRFFYCPKASKAEREAGLEDFEYQRRTDGRESDIENPRLRTSERRNTHPTVKPIALMAWLVRLITPPGGIVLDPFCGSGSTGCAAVREGVTFVGLELSEEYVQIAEARIRAEEAKCPA